MKFTTVFLGLAVAAVSNALPEALAARIPPGVRYSQIAPEDIPEAVRKTGTALNGTVADGLERRDNELQKRADHGVFLCTDANWSGYCVHIVAPAGVCVPLASDLNDKVTSVGPDTGAYCRFYFNAGCTDDDGCLHFDLTNPGYANLNQNSLFVCGTNNPNDRITSYQCWDW